MTQATQTWTEGRNFDVINPAQRTHVAGGKVEVMEVFSYGCPGCNQFQPVIASLERGLPANAQMVFLPRIIQTGRGLGDVAARVFHPRQALGISARTHQAIFDAVWKTGELAIADPSSHRLKNPLPSIEGRGKMLRAIDGRQSRCLPGHREILQRGPEDARGGHSDHRHAGP